MLSRLQVRRRQAAKKLPRLMRPLLKLPIKVRLKSVSHQPTSC